MLSYPQYWPIRPYISLYVKIKNDIYNRGKCKPGTYKKWRILSVKKSASIYLWNMGSVDLLFTYMFMQYLTYDRDHEKDKLARA